MERAEFEFEFDADDMDLSEPTPHREQERQHLAAHHPARQGSIVRIRQFSESWHSKQLDLPREQFSAAPENFIA